jgi:hypothetical protein
MNWESIQIKKERKNAIRLVAVTEKRSMASQLDLILERAGIGELTEKQLREKLPRRTMEVTAR